MHMGGCTLLEHISEKQLGALAGIYFACASRLIDCGCVGGNTLQREIFALERPSRLALAHLWNTLCIRKTALPLLCLIAHQMKYAIFQGKFRHAKLIGNFHDKCQHILTQLRDFLAYSNVGGADPDSAGRS